MVADQPSRVERRLAAILAADVAGYSRLMGLDEAGTARILREHRVVADALVAKHGGRIVKTTGDGIFLEFPSVVDAVVAYVESQKHFGLRDNHRGRAQRNTDPGGPLHATRQMPRYSVYLSVVRELRKPKSLVRSVTYRKPARGINETVDHSTRIHGPSTASS